MSIALIYADDPRDSEITPTAGATPAPAPAAAHPPARLTGSQLTAPLRSRSRQVLHPGWARSGDVHHHLRVPHIHDAVCQVRHNLVRGARATSPLAPPAANPSACLPPASPSQLSEQISFLTEKRLLLLAGPQARSPQPCDPLRDPLYRKQHDPFSQKLQISLKKPRIPTAVRP